MKSVSVFSTNQKLRKDRVLSTNRCLARNRISNQTTLPRFRLLSSEAPGFPHIPTKQWNLFAEAGEVEGESGVEEEATIEVEAEVGSVEEESPEEEEEEDRSRDRKGGRDSAEFEEQILQVSRVAKTVTGGRNVRFRVVMVVGNRRGRVGVGNASAKEIVTACRKATIKAKKNMITVPLSPGNCTFPHFLVTKLGAAKVMLRPAAEGTGVIAGGAVRTVLEIAGVRNGFGKILGSSNAMNNAKATIKALDSMRTLPEVAAARGVSIDYLLGKTIDLSQSAAPDSAPVV